jgi:uncharacterized membrane protein
MNAAITVLRPREELEQLWNRADHESIGSDAVVSFHEAPGDRGTEIYVTLPAEGPVAKLGGIAQKLTSAAPLAKVKDELRRFKQQVETGEIPRSDGTPEGESVGRKFKQRPAQPLEEAGAR